MSPQIDLSVRSGHHRGATASLGPACRTIGRDLACDIVLSDADLAARHLRLDADGRRITLTALDAPVDLPGRGEIAPGYRASFRDAVSFRAGGVDFAAQMSGHSGRATRLIAQGARLIAVGTLALGLSAAALNGPVARGGEAPRIAAMVTGPAPTPARAAPVAPAADPARIRTALEGELARQSLGQLGIEVMSDTYLLSGRVRADRSDKLEMVQRWFDAAFPEATLIANRVAFVPVDAKPLTPPQIQSVWYVGQPHIMVGGRAFYPGDAVGDGWTLVELSLERAAFDYGGSRFEVRLGAAPQEVAQR
ncbi:MAG: FHA domain-containing protein [Pseudomonadota bacterium]